MRDILLAVLAVSLSTSAAAAPQAVHHLPAEEHMLAADFEDAFVVGREAGAEHEMLFGLVDVAFAPDGELYILEELNDRVLVYGPDGEFRRLFGRGGEGPGEFGLPMSIAVTSAGEVVVWDYVRRTYHVFDRAGAYRRNVAWGNPGFWSASASNTTPTRDSLRPWPDGGVVYLPDGFNDEGDPPEDLDRGAIIHEPLGVTGAPELLLEVRNPRRRARQAGGVVSLTFGPLFAPRARWGVLPDGRLAVADGSGYEIRVIRPSTDDAELIERPIAPRPAREADRELAREREREAYPSSGGAVFGGGGGGRLTEQQIRAIVDALEFAEVIPVVRNLRVDAHGRIWIQRYGATYYEDGPIDIVTADGGYVGTLPAMPMPDAFGPDGLVAWMEGGRDVEVERVIVRRLPPSLR